MSSNEVGKFVKLDAQTEALLENAAKKMDFSPRVFFKIKKIARTIADLDNSADVKQEHILEALQYRPKEII